ncbi:hypothetical protein AUK11_04465 [bacterium CG2_30_37_16]|nr:MAG: hypothetical protein AUK11_04465 [bacterium CG2_30_37_16]PJB05159.1 MAG: hypothetical protein CO123_04620 [bacterium (Candidatus Howlettbacteria) CG_4_9_14_3_um_filter_37_10]
MKSNYGVGIVFNLEVVETNLGQIPKKLIEELEVEGCISLNPHGDSGEYVLKDLAKKYFVKETSEIIEEDIITKKTPKNLGITLPHEKAYLTIRQSEVYEWSMKIFGVGNTFDRPNGRNVDGKKIFNDTVKILVGKGCWQKETIKIKKSQSIIRIIILKREYEKVESPKNLARLRKFGKTPDDVILKSEIKDNEELIYVNITDLSLPAIRLRKLNDHRSSRRWSLSFRRFILHSPFSEV